MPKQFMDDEALERSPTAANCRMNREREIRGTNSYAADLAFDPIDFLLGQLEKHHDVAWLDLCCGTGRALIQAAEHFRDLGLSNRVSIHGLDLVDMCADVPDGLEHLKFEAESVHDWEPAQTFHLITCVHGLHYVGDKLSFVARAASWLRPKGSFAAHLDLNNIKLVGGKPFAAELGKHFKRLGLKYDRRRHIISCEGQRKITFPYRYVGADDEAGPNFTKQPVVDSYYERVNEV